MPAQSADNDNYNLNLAKSRPYNLVKMGRQGHTKIIIFILSTLFPYIMDSEEIVEKILSVKDKEGLLLVERIPEEVYGRVISRLEDQLRKEGPLYTIEFSEAVRRANLDVDDPEYFSGYRETLGCINALISNAYFESEDFSSRQIFFALIPFGNLLHDPGISSLFIAKPDITLDPTLFPDGLDLNLHERIGVKFVYLWDGKMYHGLIMEILI